MAAAGPPRTASTASPESSTVDIFPEDEEKQLLEETTAQKLSANKTFASGDYSSAVQSYEKALATCPTYLEYDIAVLHSNIAACHIKLAEWKAAVESATRALDALERVDPPPPPGAGKEGGEGGVVELEDGDDATEVRMAALARTGKTANDVYKLRTKALLRRAKARAEVGGWSALQGALEDYEALAKPPHQLAGLDRSAVQAALRELPPKLNKAKDEEMADMMGKLKQLGNGILKPFGLSTDNFQFTQDPSSGGYSMQFNQGNK